MKRDLAYDQSPHNRPYRFDRLLLLSKRFNYFSPKPDRGEKEQTWSQDKRQADERAFGIILAEMPGNEPGEHPRRPIGPWPPAEKHNQWDIPKRTGLQ